MDASKSVPGSTWIPGKQILMKWDWGIRQFLFTGGKNLRWPNMFGGDSVGTVNPSYPLGLGHKYLPRTLARVIPCFKEKWGQDVKSVKNHSTPEFSDSPTFPIPIFLTSQNTKKKNTKARKL